MTVIQAYDENARAITVVNGHDAGHFFMIEHRHPERTAITLAITSSYGTYGHHWNNFGKRSAVEVLSSLSFDYAMGKLKPGGLRVFCEHKAIEWARSEVVKLRRERAVSKDGARDMWDDISGMDYGQSAELFFDRVASILNPYYHDREMWQAPACMIDDPQCVGLWRDLWPGFIEQLSKVSQTNGIGEGT